MKRKLLVSTFILLFNPLVLDAEIIKICMDEDWFPYTFLKGGENSGIHFDIVQEAFKSLEYTPKIVAKPWKRCQLELDHGTVEAIFPASYKENRDRMAHYPSDAVTAKKSQWRINEVEHVLVTREGDSYEFEGDILKIPQPIGIGFGSAFGETLVKKGITVSENISKQKIVDMLMLKRINSAAFARFQAEEFNTKGEHTGKLKIHNIPLRSKSYFLIFSKKGKLSGDERMKIWGAFSKVRKNKSLMH